MRSERLGPHSCLPPLFLDWQFSRAGGCACASGARPGRPRPRPEDRRPGGILIIAAQAAERGPCPPGHAHGAPAEARRGTLRGLQVAFKAEALLSTERAVLSV